LYTTHFFFKRPILGGYLNAGFGWRGCFYIVAAYGLFIFFCLLFILPETWSPSPTLTRSEKPSTGKEKIKKINPLKTFRFLKNPNIVLSVAFTGTTFMMYYMITTTFSRTYTLQYGFSSGTVGLCYLPVAAGCIAGSNIGGCFADRTYNRRAAAANGNVIPETRISLEAIGLAVFVQMWIHYLWLVFS
jgi:predicted MFS family arabinose efflux permease